MRSLETIRVAAIIATYNEDDILEQSIMKLVNQGIGVYVIDNWSTDLSSEILRKLNDKGFLLGLELFPKIPSKYFELTKLMKRTEEVVKELDADWVIYQDVDEVRVSPWVDFNLVDAIERVHVLGYNAINHTVLIFEPVDNGFQKGMDFEDYFRYFHYGTRPGHFVQIRTFKNMKGLRLNASGHTIYAPNLKVFPHNFLLKHYPIRSQSQGEKKVFEDRKKRFSPEERQKGWHFQYDIYRQGCNFLIDPKTLIMFDKEKQFEYSEGRKI